MAIYRIFKQRVFEPEAVIVMAKAYEDTLAALQLSDRQDPITELVAKKIVEIAETGEHDPLQLRDRALEEIRGEHKTQSTIGSPADALGDQRGQEGITCGTGDIRPQQSRHR
jgi:hypothetical protein